MDSLCDYCKANALGVEFQSTLRGKQSFTNLRLNNNGSIKQVRTDLSHNISNRCRCDEEQLERQLSLYQQKNQVNLELGPIIQRIVCADNKNDSNKTQIIFLLKSARSDADIQFCRDKLWKLTHVNLSQCQLTEVPSSIGEVLVGVKTLNLANNCLKVVPRTLASCVKLELLNMNSNQCRYIPSWLAKLKNIKMECNMIMSLSPQEKVKNVRENIYYENKDWIQVSDPYRNRLVYFNNKSGEVCSYLTDSNGFQNRKEREHYPTFTQLEELRLSHNRLTAVPESIGTMSSLRVLYLANNHINLIPLSIGNLLSLQVLDARENNLASIPNEMNKLCSLVTLNVSSNNINHFPEFIIEMRHLKHIDMSRNKMACIPYKIGFNRKISLLNLCSNPINDPPYEVFTQTTEKILYDCRQKYLEEKHRGSLQKINVHECGIGSEYLFLEPDLELMINEKLRMAEESFSLYLEHLNLSMIPDNMYLFNKIRTISLNGNPLSVLDWKAKSPSPSLLSLSMKDCRLRYISNSILYLANLEYLDLDCNDITAIPEEVCRLNKLKVLRINKNNLTTLPQNIGDIPNLREIYLNYNYVDELPTSIIHIVSLTAIHSSHNKLKHIPSLLTRLKHLQILNLRHNNLKSVPVLGKLKLDQLYLSGNEIEDLSPAFFLPNMIKTL